MIVQWQQHHKAIYADLSQGVEIGIPVQRGTGATSFGIDQAKYEIYRDGDFVGNKKYGGPCNLETITFTPHGNSTHTECLGHISLNTYFVNDCITDDFKCCSLISLGTAEDAQNHVILDFSAVNWQAIAQYNALVVRTAPNDDGKKTRNYSGKYAPYIAANDMQRIVDAGIQHLLVDVPSVDPERDGGLLAAHHIFWNYPLKPRTDCSITEFVYVPTTTPDGAYLLRLNIANFQSDAAPSRPIIYPLVASPT